MSHCLFPCITVALRQLHKQMHLAVSAIPPHLADPDVNGASGLSSRKSVTHHEYMSLEEKKRKKGVRKDFFVFTPIEMYIKQMLICICHFRYGSLSFEEITNMSCMSFLTSQAIPDMAQDVCIDLPFSNRACDALPETTKID